MPVGAQTVKKASQSVPWSKQMRIQRGLRFVEKAVWIYKTKTLAKVAGERTKN